MKLFRKALILAGRNLIARRDFDGACNRRFFEVFLDLRTCLFLKNKNFNFNNI